MGEQMRLAALIALMFSGISFGSVEVTIVSSRGGLTNQVAFATNTFLSVEDSEFYKQEIEVSEFDMVGAVRDGTNHYQQVDYSFTTTEGKRATLVAPNIAVSCYHWHHNVGETMIFGSHTAVVTRVDAPDVVFSGVVYPDNDFCFMELDRDLPIEPCALAPKNWQDYFDRGGWSWYSTFVPVVVLNQNSVPVVGYIFTLRQYGGSFTQSLGLSVGDSGDPVLLILNGKPVLVGVMTSVKNFNTIVEDSDLMPVERGWGL
jgi:hypothetical protein